MASEVEIANVALTLLGESRIASIDDDVKAAREVKAIFDINRDALLAGYSWSFATARAQLPALAAAPDFGYSYQYQLPQDPLCLRIIQVNDVFPGLDLVDYRGASTEEFQIEGRYLLTDWTAPLKLRYIRQVVDTAIWSPNFVKAFAAYLAADLAEPLTQSDTKRERALQQLTREISLAVRANAIELPPKALADDDWLISRL